jgi:hypothetical protein
VAEGVLEGEDVENGGDPGLQLQVGDGAGVFHLCDTRLCLSGA